MSVLRHLLKAKGIEPIEAGGSQAPGQNAFCVKICSKIITSQFCIILLNNDVKHDEEVPNANVNMEYGLMLGFNKYVIPFQRQEQKLPFNVAGLDTIKYTQVDFEKRASDAIDLAISATSQQSVSAISPDQILEAFLLSKQFLVVSIDSPGDRAIYELGRPLGYNLLMTFDGLQYIFFGNFPALRAEAVLWRIRTLQNIVAARFASIPKRLELGMPGLNAQQAAVLMRFLEKLEVWVLVTSDDERNTVQAEAQRIGFQWPVRAFAISDIASALQGVA